MKKWICIILTCFLLISVPVRGYAVSPVVWGIGEEVILPFLLALLGVQASESIDSYQDLVTYNDKIKGSLLEKVSGLAGMDQVQEWIFKVVNGVIDTDSVVWKKLQEYAASQYVVATGDTVINPDNVFDIPSFPFSYCNSFKVYSDGRIRAEADNIDAAIVWAGTNSGYRSFFVLSASYENPSNYANYVYDNKTVYYKFTSTTGNFGPLSAEPTDVLHIGDANLVQGISRSNAGMYAWSMLYDAVSSVPNDAIVSTAFDSVLTSEEKDDIIDGTSVVQLYNPDALQNGLEIIPGGDPEDDPNLKKIPFAVTADWWNFLQQFGQGDYSNQYVNAYNALNGLDGTSVGRISDAYDSLGIANIVGSAANAAEGIVNLTDNNIYPNAQTVADSVNGTIPQILDPESPDSGIDNESPNGLYKLPDLREYFPFCIPFDLIHLLSILAADPVTPEFVIKLSDGNHEASTIASLEVLESVSQIVRNFELAGFCLGLILITRGIIRG